MVWYLHIRENTNFVFRTKDKVLLEILTPKVPRKMIYNKNIFLLCILFRGTFGVNPTRSTLSLVLNTKLVFYRIWRYHTMSSKFKTLALYTKLVYMLIRSIF
jgi:hypothetical protein